MARKSSTVSQLCEAYNLEYMARLKQSGWPKFILGSKHPISAKDWQVYETASKGIYKRCFPRGKVIDRLAILELNKTIIR